MKVINYGFFKIKNVTYLLFSYDNGYCRSMKIIKSSSSDMTNFDLEKAYIKARLFHVDKRCFDIFIDTIIKMKFAPTHVISFGDGDLYYKSKNYYQVLKIWKHKFKFGLLSSPIYVCEKIKKIVESLDHRKLMGSGGFEIVFNHVE